MTTVDSATSLTDDAKRLALAERLKRRAAPETSDIPRRPDGTAPPLSYAQERVWFMEQFAPGTAAYGSPLLVRLGADADLAALRAALHHVRARHESLRMRFPATDDGRPTVVVDPAAAVELSVYDAPDDATAEAQITESAARPFDLAAGPLMRTAVWRVAGGVEHILLIDLHHIITDGWSNDIVLTDLMRSYATLRAGQL